MEAREAGEKGGYLGGNDRYMKLQLESVRGRMELFR